MAARTSTRTRERELVRVTRALFDERGMQHAPVEEIARAAGITRGLIYRHFSSKEELFELAGRAVHERQARATEAYARYCLRYPAFLDACLSLMHRPARELAEIVSESVWLRLGQGMARCLDHIAAILRAGAEAGLFAVEPDRIVRTCIDSALANVRAERG